MSKRSDTKVSPMPKTSLIKSPLLDTVRSGNTTTTEKKR